MANTITVKTIGECANDLCPNHVDVGKFAVVTITTGKNVGNGSGLIQLVLCTPCANAIADEKAPATTADVQEPADTPKLRLAPAETSTPPARDSDEIDF